MVGINCNLKTCVQNLGYPLPIQIGCAKATLFQRLRNSSTNLTAYVFGVKHDIDKWASALTTTRGLLRRLKT